MFHRLNRGVSDKSAARKFTQNSRGGIAARSRANFGGGGSRDGCDLEMLAADAVTKQTTNKQQENNK
jgi:hypothetical protein